MNAFPPFFSSFVSFFPFIFIHLSFNKYFLNSCYMPLIILKTWNKELSRVEQIPILMVFLARRALSLILLLMNSYSCSLDSVYVFLLGLPRSSVGKESACSAGDLGLIPGLVRSPAEGNGNPLQCFCLENPMDRGAWRATVHGVTR